MGRCSTTSTMARVRSKRSAIGRSPAGRARPSPGCPRAWSAPVSPWGRARRTAGRLETRHPGGHVHARRHPRQRTQRVLWRGWHWPEGVPVRVHYAAEAPWVEAGEVAGLGEVVRGLGRPSRGTPTSDRATCSRIRICPGTISRRPRRCGDGCSTSSIGSMPAPRSSRGGCPGARSLPGSLNVPPVLPARRRTAGGL
jgi:hypothetical protein